MKRALPAAVLAGLLVASGAGAALAQSQLGAPQDNTVIAVPPAPLIVAAPPAPLTPAVPATPPPPGLVPLNPPPGNTGNSDNADSGTIDNGSADTGDTGAAPTAAATAAPINATPVQPAPAGAAPDQSANADSAAGAGTAGAPAQAQNQDIIPTPPNSWQPGKFAEIGVLDKVGGGVTQISVPVGGQSVVGDLQVNVLACVIRPPDQVPDAAAFLAVQNTGNLSGPPEYRGWLLRSEPGAAVAGDASETFRVIDCPQT